MRVDQQANLPSLTSPGIQVRSPAWELRKAVPNVHDRLPILTYNRPLVTRWHFAMGDLDHSTGSKVEEKHFLAAVSVLAWNQIGVRCEHYTISIDREDRMSTRLNSSHLVISYTVFCLKK